MQPLRLNRSRIVLSAGWYCSAACPHSFLQHLRAPMRGFIPQRQDCFPFRLRSRPRHAMRCSRPHLRVDQWDIRQVQANICRTDVSNPANCMTPTTNPSQEEALAQLGQLDEDLSFSRRASSNSRFLRRIARVSRAISPMGSVCTYSKAIRWPSRERRLCSRLPSTS
jgi:hypothetical protein